MKIIINLTIVISQEGLPSRAVPLEQPGAIDFLDQHQRYLLEKHLADVEKERAGKIHVSCSGCSFEGWYDTLKQSRIAIGAHRGACTGWKGRGER